MDIQSKQLSSKYTQIKVSVLSEIASASAFKAGCTASNVSMASILSEYMAQYGDLEARHRGRDTQRMVTPGGHTRIYNPTSA